MTPGLSEKLALMMATSSSSDLDEVPYESTKTERGSATPMAYESWTRTRLARPAATSDLATHRAV